MAPKRKASAMASCSDGSERSVRGSTRTKTEASVARAPRRDVHLPGMHPAITMDQLQPRTTELPGFFKLPREIRDKIYGELWQANPKISQRYKRKHYTVTYGHAYLPLGKELEDSTHAWLLTNKQMLNEGIHQFHQDSTWHFNDADICNRATEYIFPLMTPGHARTLHLNISFRQPFVIRRVDAVHRVATVRKETMAMINRMVSSMVPESDIEKLYITIWFVDGLETPYRSNIRLQWEFDLSGLERLSALTGLRQLQICTMSSKTHFRKRAHRNEAYRKEIFRVGKVLVGGRISCLHKANVTVGLHMNNKIFHGGQDMVRWRYRTYKPKQE